MKRLINKFDQVCSLGYNCYPKLYLNDKKICKETNFFDYIGTSVWSIVELINNDFDGMFDKSNYKIMNIDRSKDTEFLVVNEKYFIRCKHEFKKTLDKKFDPEKIDEYEIDEEELDNFIEKMKRRKERFMNLLVSNESVIFLRYEEDTAKRQHLIKYKDKFKSSCIEDLKALSELFRKINPNKNIMIVDISHLHDKTENIKEYGIVKIKMTSRINYWYDSVTEFNNTFSNEKKLIQSLIS